MNKGPVWYITLFVVAVLVQVLFMNNIQFSGLVNPYFYIILILLLPINTPRYILLMLGFLIGFTIDIFVNTPGIHASSSVFLAYLRPFVINVSNVDETDRMMIPSISNLGFGWFVKYASVLVLSHHIFLFFIEAFTLRAFADTLLRGGLSAVFSFVFILISQFLIFRK
jgi:rod shape-determining protein MreD